MSNIEFGTWIHVDTTPKPRKKRATTTTTKVVEKPKPIVSNACAAGMHSLCTGVAFVYKSKTFRNCECVCGICEESRAGYAAHEIASRTEAWEAYSAGADNGSQMSYEAFIAGWDWAKTYYG